MSDWVLERGGMLSREDLGAYEVIEREPARVTYRGREVLTNPPPSSGGILIADALGILERLDRPHDPYVIAEVIASTNRARDEEFLEGLATEGFLERFLAKHGARLGGDGGALAARQHHAHLGDGRRGRAARRSRARTAPARAWSCRAPACISTTCSASRT